MALIPEGQREAIKERLGAMEGPVKLVMFTEEGPECPYCRETRQLLEELTELSEKLTAEVHFFQEEKGLAERFGVDKVPAIVFLGEDEKDYGMRFYGIPTGYEFVTLLEGILDVSRGSTALSEKTKEVLRRLKRDVHIQVFVTPTCPYCPGAARLAHQMALESEKVRADVVEATEFPHLAARYHVLAVPKTVINEVLWLEGAVPEDHLLREVAKAGGVEL